MGVYIYEGHALARMGVVEGTEWARQQVAEPGNRFGFYAFVDEWHALQAELRPGEVRGGRTLNLLPTGGDGAIYGLGGYSRYVVRGDGEIVLLAWSIGPEVQERARQAGFRVV